MFDTFCTDLIALFWNHLWGCDDCFSKTIGFAIFCVIGLFLICVCFNCFFDWFERKLDKWKYKKENEDLKSQIKECNDMIDDLRTANNELSLELSRIEN